MQLAAVLAHAAFSEQRVIGGHRLHRRDHGLAVGCTADLVDRLEIVEHRGINPGLHVVRHDMLGMPFLEATRECPRCFRHVPIERHQQQDALRSFEPQPPHVVLPHDQRRQLLALRELKLGRLLERVRGIATGIGKRNRFGARALRLQQQRRKVAGPDRVAGRAQHLPALLHEFLGELLLQVVAKGVVGGDEVDALDALLRDRAGDAVTVGPGVVGPVHGVGRALGAGEQRRAGARADQHLVVVAHDLANRQRDRRVGNVGDHADALVLEPAPRDRGAEIGLVLMVGGDHLDFAAGCLAAVVLDRQLRADHGAWPLVVRVDAAHVVEDADADGTIDLRQGRYQGGHADERNQSCGQSDCGSHAVLPGTALLCRALCTENVVIDNNLRQGRIRTCQSAFSFDGTECALAS